jgi:hypothetical protein
MAESARGGFLRRATRSILSRYPTRLIGEVFDTNGWLDSLGLGWAPFKDMEKEMQELTDRFSRMLSRRPSRSSGTREALTVADWSP